MRKDCKFTKLRVGTHYRLKMLAQERGLRMADIIDVCLKAYAYLAMDNGDVLDLLEKQAEEQRLKDEAEYKQQQKERRQRKAEVAKLRQELTS